MGERAGGVRSHGRYEMAEDKGGGGKGRRTKYCSAPGREDAQIDLLYLDCVSTFSAFPPPN